MKLLCVLALFLSSLTVGKNVEFSDFLNQFRIQSLPIKYDCNFMELFPDSKDWYNGSIDEESVRKWICNSKNNDYLKKDNHYFYGIQYQSGNNNVCLVAKKKTEPGNSYYNNLLSTLIVLIYDQTGKQISQVEIARNSDMYFAKSYFLNDSVIHTIQTVKMKSPPDSSEDAYVDMIEFKIEKSGVVSQKKLWTKRRGKVIFNDQPGNKTVVIRIDENNMW